MTITNPSKKQALPNLKLLNSRVDALFKGTLKSLPKNLSKNMKYLYQGKRIRTKLIFNAAKIFDCKLEHIVFPAYAVELIHTVSLLHDDVIDVDHKRRGAKTINSIFDNQAAVFLGDYLIKNLFLDVHQTNIDLKIKIVLLKKLNEICEGELLQNSFSFTKKKVSKDNLIDIAKKKTGALFALSATLPLLIKEVESEVLSFFELCGYAFGISYQLIDDYKDRLEDYQSNKNTGINYSLQTGDINAYPKVFFEKTLEKIKEIFFKLKKKLDKNPNIKNVEFYNFVYKEITTTFYKINPDLS